MATDPSAISCPERLRGRLCRRDGVVGVTTPGDTTVLMDVRQGKYYTLNSVSARIWELLAQQTTLDHIAARLGEEFEVPVATLRADLVVVLRQLNDAGLLLCK